ncbi:hypothetical protein VTO73DRAFT_15117 [Trametes versicolor]
MTSGHALDSRLSLGRCTSSRPSSSPSRFHISAGEIKRSCLRKSPQRLLETYIELNSLTNPVLSGQSLSTLLAARPVGVLATRIHCKPSIATSLDNTIPKRSITRALASMATPT